MKTLQKFLCICCCIFPMYVGIAQSQAINYKAIIRDDSGAIIANDLIIVQFSILQGDTQTNVYTENHTPTTDANGLIVLNISEGTALSGDYTTIDWASDDHFLHVQINAGGGLVDMGTTQFLSVPYALHAQTAQNVLGLAPRDEGNGIGWRLTGIGDNSSEGYGAIGLNAIDLSVSDANGATLIFPYGATGEHAFATGINTIATGSRAIAMGIENRASGDNAMAVGRSNVASNNNSFAIGLNNTASGSASFAGGASNEASGSGSVVFGSTSDAIGLASFASGIGLHTDAYLSVAFGRGNIGGGDPDVWVATDPLFEIGNGSPVGSNDSNALTIFKNGNIAMADSMISVDGVTGDLAIALGNRTISNGESTLTAGEDTQASGDAAVAFGSETNASGNQSFAVGNTSNASGGSSTATGFITQASGFGSVATGGQTQATGTYSFTMGNLNTATGTNAVAMGRSNIAPSFSETVIGLFSEVYTPTSSLSYAATDRVFTVGNGANVNNRSNAITVLKNGNTGIGTSDPQERLHIANGRLRIGTETVEDTGSNRLEWNSSLFPDADDAFQLGGSALRWTAVWATDGTINTSDRREKRDIQHLKYGLREILNLTPVSFRWKAKPAQGEKLGLIAQDLLEIIPEVVKTHEFVSVDEEGTLQKKELDRLGVYYTDLIPVLIKAIQEQQELIQDYKTEQLENKTAIADLQAQMNQLTKQLQNTTYEN